MSDMDKDITLWCFLEGEDDTFFVVTSPTTVIAELKETIEKNINTGIPARKLKLWKVCYF
jgi:hypothetical protein